MPYNPIQDTDMPPTLQQRRRWIISLFLAVWALYGMTTNLWDQYGYNLMHAGVEAIAERRTFCLLGSDTPKFAKIGEEKPMPGRDASTDVFFYHGRLYPVKQPGMFFLGAIIYKPLSLMGLRYNREYNLAAALVSWLTSGLLGALAVALLFAQALREGLPLRPALIAALSLGIGTIFFAYGGVLHHDFIAGCLFFFAYYLLYGRGFQTPINAGHFLFAGLLGGFAVTTSVLAVMFVAPFAAAVIWSRGLRPFFILTLGFIIGLIPLLFYDWACFGNPFMLPNAAAKDVYTLPQIIPWKSLKEQFFWYFISWRSLWAFSPILIFAFWGLCARIKEGNLNKDAWMLVSAVSNLFLTVPFIPSRGGSAFGPRYLLPAVPLLAVGVLPILQKFESWRKELPRPLRQLVWALFGLAFSMSVAICFSGALRGSMHGMDVHPYYYRLTVALGLSSILETPGAFPLLYPLIFLTAAVFFFFPRQKQES